MSQYNENEHIRKVIKSIQLLIALFVVSIIVFIVILNTAPYDNKSNEEVIDANDNKTLTNSIINASIPKSNYWTAPNIESLSDLKQKEMVLYGKELIAHTSKYLGPNGIVLKISNGLNCQNCHLDAGTKVWGNNYGSVASLYPKFRARSGAQENIYKRVNDCFERSLNGKSLDTLGKEMQAIKAYIEFLGSNVEKGKKAEGSGFKDLAYLDRAADPLNGKLVYIAKCQSCHQENGEGTQLSDGSGYTFPPLWGKHSYNDGAGLYRISNFAKYVKYNMPLGTSHENPQLTDEESWDVAAYVNSQPRPHIKVPKDWPDKSKKPIDHPFGPYADAFSEKEHKFGPFKPIEEAKKKL
jgi:thiosulfate dehydrogenase